MRFFIVVLFSWLSLHRASASFSYSIRGGAQVSFVDERFILADDGVLSYSTLSNFPYSAMPNQIGTFSLKLSSQESNELHTEVKKIIKKIRAKDVTQEISESLDMNGNHLEWSIQESGLKLKQWRARMANLRSKIREQGNAIQAMELQCSPKEKKLECRLVNRGQREVVTIDPLEMGDSLWCLSVGGREVNINKSTTGDPRTMHPKKITIRPGDHFFFQIPLHGGC